MRSNVALPREVIARCSKTESRKICIRKDGLEAIDRNNSEYARNAGLLLLHTLDSSTSPLQAMYSRHCSVGARIIRRFIRWCASTGTLSPGGRPTDALSCNVDRPLWHALHLPRNVLEIIV